MELSLIHNYFVPGGIRGLRTIKQRKRKSMGPSEWCVRLMLVKLLYIMACTKDHTMCSGGNGVSVNSWKEQASGPCLKESFGG